MKCIRIKDYIIKPTNNIGKYAPCEYNDGYLILKVDEDKKPKKEGTVHTLEEAFNWIQDRLFFEWMYEDGETVDGPEYITILQAVSMKDRLNVENLLFEGMDKRYAYKEEE